MTHETRMLQRKERAMKIRGLAEHVRTSLLDVEIDATSVRLAFQNWNKPDFDGAAHQANQAIASLNRAHATASALADEIQKGRESDDYA